MKKAVVLLSGGVDSSTVLAIARAEGNESYALSFDYCQRHRIELEYARMMARAMKANRHLIVSFDLREIGGSALTADIEVPKSEMEKAPRQGAATGSARAEEIPVTYVPARNTIFLSFGLAWAEVLGADSIYIGANAIDYSGYPDCRPEYLEAFENMANLATKVSVEGQMKFKIRAPLISMKKSEIIARGNELGVDYSLAWSCYDPQAREKSGVMGQESGGKTKHCGGPHDSSRLTPDSSLIPCGRCDSCRLRAKGFAEAGIKDPLTEVGIGDGKSSKI
jgi:7-cyano-7-deazaguanine synthase